MLFNDHEFRNDIVKESTWLRLMDRYPQLP